MNKADLKQLANIFVHGAISYLALHLPDIFDGTADHVEISAIFAGSVMALRAAADLLERYSSES